MILKSKSLLIILTFVGCSTPKLVINKIPDNAAISTYTDNCLTKYLNTNSNTAKEYWYDICTQEAQKVCYKLDSTIIHKGKAYPFNQCPNRIKNNVENIVR